MATQEKTIQEQIVELEIQLKPKSTTGEEIDNMINELQEQLGPRKEINTMINELEEQLGPRKDEKIKPKPYHKKEEKKLLILIDEQETIIQFLTKQLEEANNKKLDLEYKLECHRYLSY